MNERLSEQTKKRAKKKRKSTTIQLTPELELFLFWLRYEGEVNTSEFTRALWKNTPEFQDFKNLKEDYKQRLWETKNYQPESS